MEQEQNSQEEVHVEQKSSLHQVTPLSKYLAMALFIILPFLGGYIGYSFAPEKVVEVERVVTKEIEVGRNAGVEPDTSSDDKGISVDSEGASELERCDDLTTGGINTVIVTNINAVLGTDKVTVTYNDGCVFSYETRAQKIDSDDWKKYIIQEIVERINGSEIATNPPVTYTDVADVIEFVGDSYPNDPVPEV